MYTLIPVRNSHNTSFYNVTSDTNIHGTFDNCELIQYEKHYVHDSHISYTDKMGCNINL